jgi:hypothetical protein
VRSGCASGGLLIKGEVGGLECRRTDWSSVGIGCCSHPIHSIVPNHIHHDRRCVSSVRLSRRLPARRLQPRPMSDGSLLRWLAIRPRFVRSARHAVGCFISRRRLWARGQGEPDLGGCPLQRIVPAMAKARAPRERRQGPGACRRCRCSAATFAGRHAGDGRRRAAKRHSSRNAHQESRVKGSATPPEDRNGQRTQEAG